MKKYGYRIYVFGYLHCSTKNINIHQKMLDRLNESGLLQHASEERVQLND